VRIVTFNIKHGQVGNWRPDPRLLAQTCVGFRADLLALQEVDRWRWRTLFVDEVKLVADATGTAGTFGETKQGLAYRYGDALFARGGFSAVDVLDLPRPFGGEPRVATLAKVILRDGTSLAVASAHLSIKRREAATQVETILEALGERPLPRVLLGDFNLGPQVVEPALIAAGYTVASTGLTFPANQPDRRIDYIAVAGLDIVEAYAGEPTGLSDHRPVIAEVRLSQ
jgi:endonuclease/exonuclease/phosphatase family metal-dependent hydrolase